jgi:glycosyltransferase involved in cell wall biosynthesis
MLQQITRYNRGMGRSTKVNKQKPRLCVIVNPPLALLVFRSQWMFWMKQGFDVSCVTGPWAEEHERMHKVGIKTYVVPMERYPSPFRDIISLARMWYVLLCNRFDLIHISTPKASFLGALAARLSGHKRVFYLLRGRPYEHMTGYRRKIINLCEWLTCHLSQIVVPVSRELGQTLVKEGICPAGRVCVIAHGSSAGVDLNRFTRTVDNLDKGLEIRRQFGISSEDIVILFAGWLRREKGTNELVRAFEMLASEYPNVHLILLGNYVLSDPLEAEVISSIENCPRIHHLAWQDNPAPVFAASDIFALPTYREGFPRAALEAAAMELPVVATDVMGCRETVKNGHTGLLVQWADAEALRDGLMRLIDDPDLRKTMGLNGRIRVEREFRQETVWRRHLEKFRELIYSGSGC